MKKDLTIFTLLFINFYLLAQSELKIINKKQVKQNFDKRIDIEIQVPSLNDRDIISLERPKKNGAGDETIFVCLVKNIGKQGIVDKVNNKITIKKVKIVNRLTFFWKTEKLVIYETPLKINWKFLSVPIGSRAICEIEVPGHEIASVSGAEKIPDKNAYWVTLEEEIKVTLTNGKTTIPEKLRYDVHRKINLLQMHSLTRKNFSSSSVQNSEIKKLKVQLNELEKKLQELQNLLIFPKFEQQLFHITQKTEIREKLFSFLSNRNTSHNMYIKEHHFRHNKNLQLEMAQDGIYLNGIANKVCTEKVTIVLSDSSNRNHVIECEFIVNDPPTVKSAESIIDYLKEIGAQDLKTAENLINFTLFSTMKDISFDLDQFFHLGEVRDSKIKYIIQQTDNIFTKAQNSIKLSSEFATIEPSTYKLTVTVDEYNSTASVSFEILILPFDKRISLRCTPSFNNHSGAPQYLFRENTFNLNWEVMRVENVSLKEDFPQVVFRLYDHDTIILEEKISTREKTGIIKKTIPFTKSIAQLHSEIVWENGILEVDLGFLNSKSVYEVRETPPDLLKIISYSINNQKKLANLKRNNNALKVNWQRATNNYAYNTIKITGTIGNSRIFKKTIDLINNPFIVLFDIPKNITEGNLICKIESKDTNKITLDNDSHKWLIVINERIKWIEGKPYSAKDGAPLKELKKGVYFALHEVTIEQYNKFYKSQDYHKYLQKSVKGLFNQRKIQENLRRNFYFSTPINTNKNSYMKNYKGGIKTENEMFSNLKNGPLFFRGNNYRPTYQDSNVDLEYRQLKDSLSYPIVGVSIYEANAYTLWVNGKIPTLSQYKIMGDLDNSSPYKKIQPVSKTSGLNFVIGNIYEWCFNGDNSLGAYGSRLGANEANFVIPLQSRNATIGFRYIIEVNE